MNPSAEWLQGRNYLATFYGERFADASIASAKVQMLKNNANFKRMDDLRWKSVHFKSGMIGRLVAKIAYYFLNVCYPYRLYEEEQIALAERMIRIGEAIVFVTPPNSSCMFPSNWYQAKHRSKG